jgi:hypothetical protein
MRTVHRNLLDALEKGSSLAENMFGWFGVKPRRFMEHGCASGWGERVQRSISLSRAEKFRGRGKCASDLDHNLLYRVWIDMILLSKRRPVVIMDWLYSAV